MKYIVIILSFFFSVVQAQQLIPNGMESIESTNDLSQKENFDKIQTYIKDYVVNEDIKIKNLVSNEQISLEGKQKNVACFINKMMASKTCFELRFTMVVHTHDNGFLIDVTDLEVFHDNYPEQSYTSWFDANGNPYPQMKDGIDATSEYFVSYKLDFEDYIETGDYW